MITPELVTYIRNQTTQGIAPEKIRTALLSQGWTSEDITTASAGVLSPPAPTQTFLPSPPANPAMKILLSAGLIVVSAAYVVWHTFSGQSASTAVTSPVQTNTTVTTSLPTTTEPKPVSGTPTPTQTPVVTATPPKPKGQYTDGTYTGNAADAYYGLVQVEAVVQGGKLTDVKFLQYPNDRSTSKQISARAMPLLTEEAITVQSANVDIVSGATEISQAFQSSLSSALVKAKA